MYTVEFRVDSFGCESEFTGFENIKTKGFFEPGWSMELLFHDIFEHWFEDSIFFKTKELSQAGECVAMGIRHYFFEYIEHTATSYIAFNKREGWEWNSWNICLGQICDNLYNDDTCIKYPNDFNYTHLPEWDGENLFEGCAKNSYVGCDLMKSYYAKVETAYSYGYWLGAHMFDDILHLIPTFCDNLALFLKTTGLSATDEHSGPEFPIHNRILTVDVRKDNIVAKFCDVYITAKQEEATVHRSVNQFLNQFQYCY